MLEMNTAKELFESRGYSMTRQRRAVIRALEGNTTHPTAIEVFEAVRAGGDNIARASVYNCLSLFEELGLVKALRGAGQETRFDPETSDHHHFRCDDCGSLHDLPGEGVELSVKTNHRVLRSEVLLIGTCDACAA